MLVFWLVNINRVASQKLSKVFPSVFGNTLTSYRQTLINRIENDLRSTNPMVVLEAGGVDRPLIKKSADYKFVGLDIEERPDCAHLYDTFYVQSIEEPIPIKCNLLISFTLLEHVPDNRSAVRQMYEALEVGGTTHHYVPSGLHPYSLSLRLVGPYIQKKLIPILRPGAEDVSGYPAFFNKCTPQDMIREFELAGFTDISFEPFYRANDYFAFFVPIFLIVSLFENFCRVFGISKFASGFVISARKSAIN